jgi:hypothetical protein
MAKTIRFTVKPFTFDGQRYFGVRDIIEQRWYNESFSEKRHEYAIARVDDLNDFWEGRSPPDADYASERTERDWV